MVKINKIGIKQTAKVFAVMYFLISAVFILPMAFITMFFGSLGSDSGGFSPFGGIFFLFLPFIYAGLGFLIVALMSFIYNFVAGKIGGVEIELDSDITSVDKPEKST